MSDVAPLPPESERLRRFCQAMLAALDHPESELLPSAFVGRMVDSLESGASELALQFREEAESLQAALAHLRGLPRRYLKPNSSADSFLSDLESAYWRTVQIADSLAPLASPMLSPALRPLPQFQTRQPLGSFSTVHNQESALLDRSEPHDCPDQTPLARPSESPIHQPLIHEHQSPPARASQTASADAPTESTNQSRTVELDLEGSSTHRAARIFEAGQFHHKRREMAEAERCYTEAIQTDPCFGPAFSRRGQVRLARGAIEAAVADFTLALELDEFAAEAWWWRGDAHALAQDFDSAIADYRQALELRPDLNKARQNLMVAERRKEELAGVADRPAPETLPPPSRSSAPTTAVLPPPPRPQSPASTLSQPGQLVVNCPHCELAGEVPWDRLGKVFFCKGCQKRFGVRSDGKTVELVEGPGGRWVEASIVRNQKRRRNKKRRTILSFALAILLFPALGFAGWQATRPAPKADTETPLPNELEARAELFARSWISNDIRTMKRLTTPAQDKILYAWYNRHRPPTASRVQTGGPIPEGAKFEILRKPARVKGRSFLQVRVAMPGAKGAAELAMIWEDREGNWFFMPKPK